MAEIKLKEIVDRIIDLPALPQVVVRINSLLEDPRTSAKDVSEVMKSDPALAGKILKIVNSAFYGLPRKVSSISQAVVILGFSTVKSLAISASVLDIFGSEGSHFSYDEFWKYSVGCATVCNTIASGRTDVDPDTAFVLGLMHDMGKLILDQFSPLEFQDIIYIARAKKIPFEVAEKEVLETSHSEVGYWLMRKWQLETDLAEAVHHQHTLDTSPSPISRKYGAVCAFSSYICRLKEYGHNGSYGKPELPVAAWKVLGMNADDLPRTIESINKELKRADEFLALVNS